MFELKDCVFIGTSFTLDDKIAEVCNRCGPNILNPSYGGSISRCPFVESFQTYMSSLLI